MSFYRRMYFVYYYFYYFLQFVNPGSSNKKSLPTAPQKWSDAHLQRCFLFVLCSIIITLSTLNVVWKCCESSNLSAIRALSIRPMQTKPASSSRVVGYPVRNIKYEISATLPRSNPPHPPNLRRSTNNILPVSNNSIVIVGWIRGFFCMVIFTQIGRWLCVLVPH